MEENNKKNLGGFSHYATDEQIQEYQKVSVADRLQWLEELVEFMYMAMPKENWEIMQKFRRGEL